VDEDLFEHRPALAADVGRQRATDEPGPDRRVTNGSPSVGVDAPARSLEVGFERLEDVARESARSILKLELSGRQRQIHGAKDGVRDKRGRGVVAGRGTEVNERGPVGDRPSMSVAPEGHGHRLLLLY
jgi:hypothetical protein